MSGVLDEPVKPCGCLSFGEECDACFMCADCADGWCGRAQCVPSDACNCACSTFVTPKPAIGLVP